VDADLRSRRDRGRGVPHDRSATVHSVFRSRSPPQFPA
jgi:hypothetical protein